MTSRPGPGIHESLPPRSGAGAPRSQLRRRPSVAASTLVQPDCIDPTLEDERPPLVHAASETARPPPRGRPPIFFTASAVASNGVDLPIHALPPQPTANLPAPPRPGSLHLRAASQQRRILPGGTGVKDAPKLTAPEVLPPLVHFADGKPADLAPWTGTDSDDTMSEALVKVGVSNKPQIMNETNTARPSLWSNLKNKSGLSTLSTLFAAVLEKRQQSGRLQIANTFKPPPRLTLRDSTREQWLHDLASPSTGLRRLSRTIPHGLTGKVLLEQCLNKNIPLPRALWLAKCVGINELRAHKRKGQAGTVTWGRGWTSSVEQFLDGVTGAIGQGDWKPRITYALQLAIYLYKEHLLDDDHFLDWIVNGLETCPSERLFLWLLIVCVPQYWVDITCCRRRGKRFAESLLHQLDKIYRLEDQSPFAAVLQQLENTLVKLIAIRPACLLLPTTWAKHGILLHKLEERRRHPQITQAVKKLDERNRRLLQSSKNVPSTSHAPSARVYRILDSINYNNTVLIEDLSFQCMEVTTNATELVAVLMRWASSCYRQGTHRTYLATRLLRKWSHLGADIYDSVLSYLGEMTWVGTSEPSIIFKIVAELVRSNTFSAGHYLQWLIATGSLEHDTDLFLPAAWPVRLITEIPLSGLSDQVRTLRSTLLRGTAHSADLEEQTLRFAKRTISQALPNLFCLNNTTKTSEVEFDTLSSTVKLELGIWLRRQVAQHAEVIENVPTKDPSTEETAAISLLTPLEFHVVRSYLESFDDLAILADVIDIATSSLDPIVLAFAADTLNCHLKVFRTIGALDSLFDRIATRYAALRTIRFLERDLLSSLFNLAYAVHADGQLLHLLSYDLSRLDQKNTIAACSPASDNMGEVMHTGSYSDDEIDRILSSGTNMDQQMMARVFRKIINNLEEQSAKGRTHFDSYPPWFHRLRSFDEPTFDVVVSEWLYSCLMVHQVKTLQVSLPTLVGSGCMALSALLDMLLAYLAKFSSNPSERAFQTTLGGLRILLPSDELAKSCSPQDAYRYRTEQQRLSQGQDDRLFRCIGGVVNLGVKSSSPKDQGQLSSLLFNEPVRSILKHYVISDPGRLSGWSGEAATPYIKSLLETLLDPVNRLQLSMKTSEQQVLAVFGLASDLSLPFCQAVIEQVFSSQSELSSDSAEALSAALLSAIKIAVEEDAPAGLELLAGLDAALTDQIRQHAEREIINASSFFTIPSNTKAEDSDQISPALAQKYLTVIDLTSGKRTVHTEQSAMLSALIERLKGIEQTLSMLGNPEEQPSEANNLSVPELYAWLNALLCLAVPHCSTMLPNATHQQQATMMTAMKTLILHPLLERYPSITEHIFDVAVFFSDYISDDIRFPVSRPDNNPAFSDIRCLYILGAAAPVDGWLVLTKPVTTISNQAPSQPPTPSAGQSQSSPFQSPQVSTPGPVAPQQRYLNQQRQQQIQSQQTQHMRAYSQYPQQSTQPNKILPSQLQRTPSNQTTQFSIQQMQQMQHIQGLAQQRALQPSPVYTQRPTPAAGHGQMDRTVPGKLQIRQERDVRQYPFVQPRWEILAESSGNPNTNETALSLTLFGARKV